ncbi:MAG: hypothetical protein ACLQJ0_23470 [Steroidobacteraceae bacterium]|jgi:hypothetical protein
MNAAVAGTSYPLPDISQVRDLMGMLFDGLAVKPGAKLDLTPKSSTYFAIYVTDNGAPAALCACDIAFAANSGAALSMLPPNVAKDAARTQQLTDVMLANLREVMNICTRLVLRENTPHLRLDTVCPASKLPAAAAAIVAAAKGRIDFEIGLGKYAGGLFAVLVA